VGVWSSFKPIAALRFFLPILLSGALFFFLGKQSATNLWRMPPILSGYGIVLVTFFLLTQDWQQYHADVELINLVGSWWMAIRPEVPFAPPHQNMIAGMLSIIIPLNFVWWVREKNRKNLLLLVIALAVLGYLAIGLWLTSSRGAWFSLLVGLFAGAGLERMAKPFKTRGTHIFLGLLCCALVVIIVSLPVVMGVARTVPDVGFASDGNSIGSRITLYRYALDLAKEHWLLGGGLGSFPGLYSSYILLLPFPIFYYSHNIYLDIWIEQGIVGLAAWLIILAGSIWLVGRTLLYEYLEEREARLLCSGILASLLALSLHGLVDNPIYAEWGRPLLFVLPGMAIALVGNLQKKPQSNRTYTIESRQKQKNFSFAAIFVIFLTILAFNKPVRSAWNANMGAIAMAKYQLFEWPSGKWPEKSMGEKLVFTEPFFEKALNLQNSNQTAAYRTGLIEFYNQNFFGAEQFLKQAYQLNGHHRGIQKALGYTYVWLGEFDQAALLLSSMPEIAGELDAYIWWWAVQNRNDLVENAKKMATLVKNESKSSSGND
jgi:hypothetical protein